MEPWEVRTIDDCAQFVPTIRPLNLPVTDRSATEFEVGTWKLMLTYEGLDSESSFGFEDENLLEIELDGAMSQDSIKSNPNFPTLRDTYGYSEATGEFAPTVAGDNLQNGLSGPPQPKASPLYGVDSYLAIGAIFRVTVVASNAPNSVMEKIGEIVERPPGYGFLGVPAPIGRNWLKLAPKISRKGNGTRISLEYMLSGPKGWNKEVYNFSQLSTKKVK